MALAPEASSSSSIVSKNPPLHWNIVAGEIIIVEEASVVQAAQEASTSREQAGELLVVY